MEVYVVKRKNKDNVIVSILWDRKYEKYRFVNMTHPHICTCMFSSIEEALNDMDNRDDVISYERVLI